MAGDVGSEPTLRLTLATRLHGARPLLIFAEFAGRVVTRTWPGRTRVEGLGSGSGRSRCLPILKRFASESTERIAGNEMAFDVERVLDCGINGQEPLR